MLGQAVQVSSSSIKRSQDGCTFPDAAVEGPGFADADHDPKPCLSSRPCYLLKNDVINQCIYNVLPLSPLAKHGQPLVQVHTSHDLILTLSHLHQLSCPRHIPFSPPWNVLSNTYSTGL